ncbi:MAG: hypothetical protein R2764_17155 [Bacteroidales bacterium]
MVKFKSSKIEARGGGTFDLFNKTNLSAQGKKLLKEWKKIDTLSNNSEVITYIIRKRNRENLPVEYEIIYKLRSIVGIEENGEQGKSPGDGSDIVYHKPIYGNEHRLSIILPNNYPSALGGNPEFKMISDTWHPNIRSSGKFKGRICLNDKDLGVTVGLDARILRVGKYLQYQIYWATDSYPWPEDKVVAEWVREEAEPMGWINLKEGVYTDTSTLFVKPKEELPEGKSETSEPKEEKIQKIKLTLAKLEKEVSKLTASEKQELNEDAVDRETEKVDKIESRKIAGINVDQQEIERPKEEKTKSKVLILKPIAKKSEKEDSAEIEPAESKHSDREDVKSHVSITEAEPGEKAESKPTREDIRKELFIEDDIPVVPEAVRSGGIKQETQEIEQKKPEILNEPTIIRERKELILEDEDDDEKYGHPENVEPFIVRAGTVKSEPELRSKTEDEVEREVTADDEPIVADAIPVSSVKQELVLDDVEDDEPVTSFNKTFIEKEKAMIEEPVLVSEDKPELKKEEETDTNNLNPVIADGDETKTDNKVNERNEISERAIKAEVNDGAIEREIEIRNAEEEIIADIPSNSIDPNAKKSEIVSKDEKADQEIIDQVIIEPEKVEKEIEVIKDEPELVKEDIPETDEEDSFYDKAEVPESIVVEDEKADQEIIDQVIVEPEKVEKEIEVIKDEPELVKEEIPETAEKDSFYDKAEVPESIVVENEKADQEIIDQVIVEPEKVEKEIEVIKDEPELVKEEIPETDEKDSFYDKAEVPESIVVENEKADQEIIDKVIVEPEKVEKEIEVIKDEPELVKEEIPETAEEDSFYDKIEDETPLLVEDEKVNEKIILESELKENEVEPVAINSPQEVEGKVADPFYDKVEDEELTIGEPGDKNGIVNELIEADSSEFVKPLNHKEESFIDSKQIVSSEEKAQEDQINEKSNDEDVANEADVQIKKTMISRKKKKIVFR